MKRTIFSNGRRRTLRALMFGAAVALLSVPVAQANHQFGDAVDRAKADAVVSSQPVDPAAGSLACTASSCTQGAAVLPLEDLKAIEESSVRSVYHRADDFAPPRNVTVPAATATGVDWSETAMWLAVGLAGALGLLGAALLANRSRVRMAHS